MWEGQCKGHTRMAKTTSYWRQKNRADAAELQLRSIRIRCAALVSNWALLSKKSAPGNPRQAALEQCSRELDQALKKAQEAVAEMLPKTPAPVAEEQPPAA